ncbi:MULTISPECIES: hypothetical protein [Rothia]|uniref:hypothetical protein n=1 Tax=Rothia TaxID=32207 RepID=UPI00082DEA57|nr:hypothetical protein [Rothia sp. ND6WE1A]
MKSFKESPIQDVFAYLSLLVRELDAVFGTHQYMMIGSYVRDIYICVKAGFEAPRSTQDVDFSALVVAEETFLEHLEAVGRKSGPKEGNRITCRVLNGTDVDILPFGTSSVGTLFRHREAEWDVTGHEEAYRFSEIVELSADPQISVRIPTIDCMLGLKIIAWDMRQQEGNYKDAQDFFYLLNAGVVIEVKGNELWEQYQNLLEQAEYDAEKAAALLIGIKLREHFTGMALDRVLNILKDTEQRRYFFTVADGRGVSKPLVENAFSQFEFFMRVLSMTGRNKPTKVYPRPCLRCSFDWPISSLPSCRVRRATCHRGSDLLP